MSARARVASSPYPFPLDGRLEASAVLVIDMQVDFCAPGGYMDRRGADLAGLRAPVEPIQRVLAAARSRGLHVAYTREAFRPDLSDLQPHRRLAAIPGLARVGDSGSAGRCLVAGEPGHAVIPELAPLPGDGIYDKPGYGVFAFTELAGDLRRRGIGNLVLTGVTTDCCVSTILREGLDRGFDCLTLEDCGAASTPEFHAAALTLLRRPNGAFGAVARSDDLIAALAG